MRKSVNWLILIGTIVSLIIAFRFSSMPVIDWFPENVKELWITSNAVQEQYRLLYDLSIGFIISAMFFIMIEVLPEKLKVEKAKKILAPQVNLLLQYMEQVISLVLLVYKNTNDLKSLTQKDFLILDGDTQTPNKEISYSTGIYYNNNVRKTGFREFGTLDRIIKTSIKGAMKSIEYIKSYEYFYTAQENFIEIIRRIEKCVLFQHYNESREYVHTCFKLSDSSSSIAEFVTLYLQLRKLKLHTQYTLTTLDSAEETEKYRQDRECGKYIQESTSIQKRRHECAILNPTVVIGSSKYTTQIIIKKISRNYEATYLQIKDDLELNDEESFDSVVKELKKFKYLVLIVDSLSKKPLKELCKDIDYSTKVILLSEQILRKKKNKPLLQSANLNIIDELFFKSSTKIRALQVWLNRSEPSMQTINQIVKKLSAITFKD